MYENSFAQQFAERRRLLYLTFVKLQTGRITHSLARSLTDSLKMQNKAKQAIGLFGLVLCLLPLHGDYAMVCTR